ncbi:Glucosamine-phosphate N-acetyltransferase-like protein [Glugoides intestinalis]
MCIDNYHIRELEIEDYKNGFLECLKELTIVGDITQEMFLNRFQERKNHGVFTVVAVEECTNRVLGTASIFYEPKYIRECATKAYIEDVCVASYAQKRGIGKKLVVFLEEKAINDGCYKIILTCNEQKEYFYQKMNFKKTEIAMSIYSNTLK